MNKRFGDEGGGTPTPYTGEQTDSTLTGQSSDGVSPPFSSDMVGNYVIFTDNTVRMIQAVVDGNTLTVSPAGNVAYQGFAIYREVPGNYSLNSSPSKSTKKNNTLIYIGAIALLIYVLSKRKK